MRLRTIMHYYVYLSLFCTICWYLFHGSNEITHMDGAFLLLNYLDFSIKYHSVFVVLIVAFLLFARETLLGKKDHENYHEFPETSRDRLEHRLGRGGLFVFGYDENYAVL